MVETGKMLGQIDKEEEEIRRYRDQRLGRNIKEQSSQIKVRRRTNTTMKRKFIKIMPVKIIEDEKIQED